MEKSNINMISKPKFISCVHMVIYYIMIILKDLQLSNFSVVVYGLQMMYFVWMFVPEILDVISPMNESRPRRNPFDFDFFIDEERYFYLIRFYICIILMISALVFLANSTLFLILTQHVCAMYKLLG